MPKSPGVGIATKRTTEDGPVDNFDFVITSPSPPLPKPTPEPVPAHAPSARKKGRYNPIATDRAQPPPEPEAPTTDAELSRLEKKAGDDPKKLWMTVIRPICREFSHARLKGGTWSSEDSIRAYRRLVHYMRRRMRPTPTHSHITVPMLHSLMCRMLQIPAASLDMAVVAAAVWRLKLCDRNEWTTATKADAMVLHGRFVADAREWACVPKHYMQVKSPVAFRNRAILVAGTLAGDYVIHRCEDDVEDADRAARAASLVRFTTAGFDILLDAAYDYAVRCRRARALSKADAGAKTVPTRPASEVARALFPPSALLLCRQTHILNGPVLDGIRWDPAGLGTETYAWLVVAASIIGDMDSSGTPPDTVPTNIVEGWDIDPELVLEPDATLWHHIPVFDV